MARKGKGKDWLYPARKNKEGKRLCCWCSESLSGRKRRWCGEECVHEYLVVKSDQNYLRGVAWRRDRGVCSSCKVDTERLYHQYHASINRDNEEEVTGRLKDLGFHETASSFWQADHKVPVSEGGNLLGPGNIQTLCLSCHKRKTKNQRKNRKKS